MTDPSPPLDLSALARETIGRLHILLGEALRCLADGNHVAVRRKIAYTDVLVCELESQLEAALVRVQQGMEVERMDLLNDVNSREGVISELVVTKVEQADEVARLRVELEQAQLRIRELEALASPTLGETAGRSGCINCGETEDGGYLTGRDGHVDEGAVGPFCASCWELIGEDFAAASRDTEGR